MKTIKFYITIGIVAVAIVGGIVWWVNRSTELSFENHETSTLATRIDKIEQIGEWEFLSIHDEEIVELTTKVDRQWPIPDGKKTLICIYVGTLRFGFDLKKDTKPGWIEAHGDTVNVKLPRVHLLDERFIDEAATRPLIEEGNWTHQERARLYRKAQAKMKYNCLTPNNLHRANASAKQQVEQFLRSLGFTVITIEFDK